MKIKTKVQTMAIGCGLLVAGLLVDGEFHTSIIVKEAEAVIGRPVTPGSVAGVGRRTTRRRIRRTTIYVASLPKGCTTVNIDGAVCYSCGGTYYQAHNGQYVVVKVE